jgi:hypothetical protein
MCLDQGHDFRDEGGRTNIGANKAWVNADVDKQTYLNKIKKDEFQTKYAPNEDINILGADMIFGKYEFIKGLLNTTFIGGDGAFGFAIIEDMDILSLTNQPESIIINAIIKSMENIKFDLLKTKDYYYITSQNDLGKKGNGINFTSTIDGKDINILFLPFYKRAFNNGMHKLWTFNTKKHIYIVNLNKLFIKKESSPYLNYTITNQEFTCNKLTVLDLIVPQYYFNFGSFFDKNKATKKSYFIEQFNSIIQDNEEKLKLDAKLPNILDKLSTNDKNLIFDLFSKSLFNGEFIDKMIEEETITTTNDSSELIKYKINNDGIGYFELNTDIELYKCVPRGVKYWFENCQNKAFKYFLKLLYENQKPFIHPGYFINNSIGNIDDAKTEILETLLNDDNNALNKYINIKNYTKIYTEDDEEFILKQYGIITDTSIGNSNFDSTSDILINSLNNVNDNKTCDVTQMISDTKMEIDSLESGRTTAESISNSSPISIGGSGELNFLNNDPDITDDIEDIKDSIESVENADSFSTSLKGDIKKIYKVIKNNDSLLEQLGNYLVKKFPDSEDEILDTLKMKDTFKKVAEEKITPISTLQVANKEPEAPETPVTLAPELPTKEEFIGFNNIENVNKVFDLNLQIKDFKDNKFIKINSTSSNTNINDYMNEYSNNLQQYYDFISQNKNFDIKNNYFNNCWQTVDFYQEQKGGSAYYPYKFTVASGQLDSSGLGGQSLPQYHPPEIDVYMPIFELSGAGDLKGIIVRMVVVKEILNNAINSKSQVVIFCHFVYVDFERTKIMPPSNASEYSRKISDLLNYTINNTYYIKNERCINLEELNQMSDINSEDNIDFILKFTDENGLSVRRNWYKYYTYTQGPTVFESIVVPTDGNTLNWIRTKTSESGYVARGIENVAEYIIKSSKKLRNIFGVTEDLNEEEFDTNPGIVFFVKLFLIRNKYTGDKSRATDTLFLNQTKYIEGIQVSNDENTLYNANMFGQNTIWSTTTKTVFNMAPYYTKNNKMPITSGFNINNLCLGLKDNPFITVEKDLTEVAKPSVTNEETLIKDDIREEILNKLDPSFIYKYNNCSKGKQPLISTRTSLVEILVPGIYNNLNLKQDLQQFTNFNENFSEELQKITSIINDNLNNGDPFKSNNKYLWTPITNFIKTPYLDNDSIVTTTEKVISNLKDIQTNYDDFLTTFKNVLDQIIKCKPDLSINTLYNLLFYISKNFPWWMNLNIEYYINLVLQKYCSMSIEFISKLNEKLLSVDAKNKKNLYNFIESRFKELNNLLNNKEFNSFISKYFSNINCLNDIKFDKKNFTIEIPKQSITQNLIQPLKEVDSNATPDEIAINDAKFTDATLQFINLLNQKDPVSKFKEIMSKNEDYIKEITAKTFTTKEDIEKYIKQINNKKENLIGFIPRGPIKMVETVGGEKRPRQFDEDLQTEQKRYRLDSNLNILNQNIKDNKIIASKNINKDILTNFYNDSYKCNIGNYLKKFTYIINNINKIYIDLSINQTDNIKDIFIKILLLDINSINSSYVPIINNDKIIDDLKKIDLSYNVEQMNNILNKYQEQLNIFSLIDTIINTDYDTTEMKELLASIIDDNIKEYNYKQLNLPFTKLDLLKMALTQNIDESPIETKVQETRKRLREDNNDQLSKKIKNTYNDIPNDSWMKNNKIDTSIPVYGGVSFKNKRKSKINHTKKNKIKNKNQTIKFKNIKIKRNTRRH